MKKAPKPAPQVTIVSSGTLAPAEQRMIRAFRQLNDEAQDFQLDVIEALSIDPQFQRSQLKPALRLIATSRCKA